MISAPTHRYTLRGFNCAAPFRERLARSRRCASVRSGCFNCAAPFRERLDPFPPPLYPLPASLQLCRPLSGAVSGKLNMVSGTYTTLQLCRPLSGAVSIPAPGGVGEFRVLQLCRPLSGAVRCANPPNPLPNPSLQLCRPLSGAVSQTAGQPPAIGHWASIVPPPFGSG